jgi:hypothetical protein
MVRLTALLVASSLAAVILVQHPRGCWAAETTQSQANVSFYGGAGTVSIANNESDPDEYRVRRAGAGVYGVVRFNREGDSSVRSERERGFFLAAGLSAESDWVKQTHCTFYCPVGVDSGDVSTSTFARESEAGLRVGAGYSFSLFEFRVGGLATLPSKDAAFAKPLLMPDVLLRVGSRPRGWFELGLGAYDASTVLRPGLFIGGSLFSPEQVRITAHLGLHLVYGSWESTLQPFGGMADIAFEHAFAETWLAGVGGKVMSGELFEGNLHLTRLF